MADDLHKTTGLPCDPRSRADIASDIAHTEAKLARLRAEMARRAAIEREYWMRLWREMEARGDV